MLCSITMELLLRPALTRFLPASFCTCAERRTVKDLLRLPGSDFNRPTLAIVIIIKKKDKKRKWKRRAILYRVFFRPFFVLLEVEFMF